MILFLDFDGVLHPSHHPGEALFREVPRLAAWLEARPGVDVVISSSWRMHHRQDELVEMLGPGIGSRVVGCTPWVGQLRDENVYPTGRMSVFTFERQNEIETWMASTWDPLRPWVALDDMPHLFETDCASLVVCQGAKGISAENIRELDRLAERAWPTSSRVQSFDRYLKHMGSCLPDSKFRITVDRGRRRVTIAARAFDSYLIGWLVTRILPDEHGVKAYREDDSGWPAAPAAYELRVRIGDEGGIELDAEVVRLSSAVGGSVAVWLGEPRPRVAGED